MSPWGSLGVATWCKCLNAQKQLPGETGSRLPSSSGWGSIPGGRGVRGKRGDSHPPRGHPVPRPGAVECSWSLTCLHGNTEASSRVSLNGRGKGQSLGSPSEGSVHNVPPWATQAAAGRRPRLPTSGGTGKPGSETLPRATRQRKHRLSRNTSSLTRETERPKPE